MLPEWAVLESPGSERLVLEPLGPGTPLPVSGSARLATQAALLISPAIAVQSSVSSREEETRAPWVPGLALRPAVQESSRFLLLISPQDNLSIGSQTRGDRKSTRLNSSHTVISYAVFCLKKKK